MKKVVMLSAAAILSLAGMAVSQAEEKPATDTATATATAQSDTAQPATADTEATATPAPAKEEPKVPEDPPHVQKLIALYPNLIARIQPQGKVCFQGQECDVTVTVSGPSADGKPRDGKTVYDAICHTCHASGLLNSPKLGDKGAWASRIAKGKSTLHNNALNGINAMPAKGGADIPDEEVINAVDYMIEQAS